MHSHKFITIELGKTDLLEFWGKLSTMSSFFYVVWESHGRLCINLEIKAESVIPDDGYIMQWSSEREIALKIIKHKMAVPANQWFREDSQFDSIIRSKLNHL